MLRVGAVFAGYRIEGVADRGGMGVVCARSFIATSSPATSS
jgi:hypothetical protein